MHKDRCILSLVLLNLSSHHGASHWWNGCNVDQHNQRTMCVICFMHINCGSHQWKICNGATQLEHHVCLVHPGIFCCGSNEEFLFQSKPLNCLVSILELRAQLSSQPAVLGSQSVKCQSLSCEHNCLPNLPYLAVKVLSVSPWAASINVFPTCRTWLSKRKEHYLLTTKSALE